MPRRFLAHLFSNAWILHIVSVDVSYPIWRIGTTSDLYSLNFVWKLILPINILSNLAIAVMAATIRVQISELQVPSLEKIFSQVFKTSVFPIQGNVEPRPLKST